MNQTSSATNACQYCGSTLPHPGICPNVKAIEYHANGAIKRVEFHGPQPIYQTPHQTFPPYYHPNYPWQSTSNTGGDAGAFLAGAVSFLT